MDTVFLIFSFISLVFFLLYEKAQAKLVKHLKSEINELNIKLEKQQEIINTKYNIKDL